MPIYLGTSFKRISRGSKAIVDILKTKKHDMLFYLNISCFLVQLFFFNFLKNNLFGILTIPHCPTVMQTRVTYFAIQLY